MQPQVQRMNNVNMNGFTSYAPPAQYQQYPRHPQQHMAPHPVQPPQQQQYMPPPSNPWYQMQMQMQMQAQAQAQMQAQQQYQAYLKQKQQQQQQQQQSNGNEEGNKHNTKSRRKHKSKKSRSGSDSGNNSDAQSIEIVLESTQQSTQQSFPTPAVAVAAAQGGLATASSHKYGQSDDIVALMSKIELLEKELSSMQKSAPALNNNNNNNNSNPMAKQNSPYPPPQQQPQQGSTFAAPLPPPPPLQEAFAQFQALQTIPQNQYLNIHSKPIVNRDERSTSIFTRASTIMSDFSEYTEDLDSDNDDSGSDDGDDNNNNNENDNKNNDKNDDKDKQAKAKAKAKEIFELQKMPSLQRMVTATNTAIEKSDDSDDVKDILTFWFPPTFEATMDLWFSKSPKIDDTIRNKFGQLVIDAKEGKLDSWLDDVWSTLALIILLDQFPRNIYRHSQLMYAGDSKAQDIVSYVLYHGYHHRISPLHCVSICLVLTHSESIVLQKLCLRVWKDIRIFIPSNSPLIMFDGIFKKHLDVISKFGRFPHRNEIFNRKSTENEIKFLNDKSFRFDLPLKMDQNGKYKFEKTKSFAMAAFNDGMKMAEAKAKDSKRNSKQ